MKKILTIAATALLSTIAGAAHAEIVNFPGVVTSSCSITSSAPGSLTPAIPATALNTLLPATVVVTCNGATNLALTPGVNTIPVQIPAPSVSFNFSGGTGVFASSSGLTASLLEPTLAAGDTANISATVTANGGKLLKANPVLTPYNVSVIATITP